MVTLLTAYGVGHAGLRLGRMVPADRFFALFLSLLTGLTIGVVGYALLKTRGVTVLLPLPLLLLGVLLALRRATGPVESEQKIIPVSILSPLALLLPLGLAIFAVRYLLLYDVTSEFLLTPFQDYVYYGRLTQPLNVAGIETNVLEAVYPQFLTENPYHYFEIWLNALLVRVTNLPAAWCLYLGTYSVLITVVGTGFIAILAQFQLDRRWLPVLGALLLTATGTCWPVVSDIPFVHNGGLMASGLLPVLPKLAPVYLFVLLAMLLLLRRQYVATGMAMAAMPLVFVSTTPVVGLGAATLALGLWLSHQLSIGKALAMVVPILLVCLFIAGFYGLQPEPYQFPGTGRGFTLATIIPRTDEVRLLINIGIGALIVFGIYYGGYLALLLALGAHRLLQIERQHVVLLGWFGSCLVWAALMRAFGSHFLDSFQFFSNIIVPAAATVVAVLLGAALANAPQRRYVVAAAGLLLLAGINGYKLFIDRQGMLETTRYSPAFLRQVGRVLPGLGSRGAYIWANADYENAFMLSPDSYTCGNYVSNFKNNYAFTTLSPLNLENRSTDPRFRRDSVQAEQAVRKSTFYRFYRFEQMAGRVLPLDSAKYQFVVQHGISFICTSRRARLPTTLRPLVRATYTDAYSGEALHVLRAPAKESISVYPMSAEAP
ncbi:hypothetical protein GCM10011495_15440 [Hymenobacter frigidus]|uniref:YfhO family protein n=1 Tax=Hymenobacter frigidus TaxID=1524095 RepID=A0ABQ2A4C9_9BACT|nr:hypothetical protein [Hymenobacter frigidus]GGH84163.1 hypothetical protein GCM10011495_15440 [Hymenobacter frigidus]